MWLYHPEECCLLNDSVSLGLMFGIAVGNWDIHRALAFAVIIEVKQWERIDVYMYMYVSQWEAFFYFIICAYGMLYMYILTALYWRLVINPNHPKSSQILQGALFWKNALLTVGNWYFHLFKWGKINTWQEVQGHKCWIWKINKNAWCILKIRACFQNCTGGFWRIQEGS